MAVKETAVEKRVVLITYGDMVQAEGEAPLRTLAQFVDRHLQGVVDAPLVGTEIILHGISDLCQESLLLRIHFDDNIEHTSTREQYGDTIRLVPP